MDTFVIFALLKTEKIKWIPSNAISYPSSDSTKIWIEKQSIQAENLKEAWKRASDSDYFGAGLTKLAIIPQEAYAEALINKNVNIERLRNEYFIRTEQTDKLSHDGGTKVPSEFTVTKHAIDRWRERTGDTGSDLGIRNKIVKKIHAATEVELTGYYKAIALINHNFQEARYYQSGKWIFVVEEHSKAIKTVHEGTAERWTPIQK